MDVQEQVTKILTTFKNGDEFIQRHEWSAAVLQYGEATAALMELPKSEEFDRLAFMASCLACVATVNLGLGNHATALECAEKALSFFDRSGNMYPAARGRWLLAILSKGIASSVLGRTGEAETCRFRAKEILRGSQSNPNFRAEIDQFIRTLDDLIAGKRVRTRAWWQFWK
jgi:hypothetical protein